MPVPRSFTFLDLVVLSVVLALAGGSRAWYVSRCADDGAAPPPIRVQTDAADSPHTADSHFPAVYPWLVGQLDSVWGEPASRTMGLRWIQVALGALTAGLYCLFAWWAFNSRLVGLLAGVLCALHPFWVFNTAQTADGVLTAFLLAACLFLGSVGGASGGALTSWFYGLGLAALALLRAALLPFGFVAVLWYLLRCRTHQRGWLYALLVVLGFGTGLAPWAASVYRQPGETFFLVHEAYAHLWQCNNPAATGGPVAPGQPDGWDKTDRQLATEVWQEIQDNPTATVQRRIRAELDFFLGDEWFKPGGRLWQDNLSSGNNGMPPPLAEASPGLLYGALLGMMTLGLLGWRWSYGWRRQSMPASLAVLWIPLPYVLSHGPTLAGPRLPLDGIFLTYTAVVVACIVPAVGRSLFLGEKGATRD